jgi:hypothetical protein
MQKIVDFILIIILLVILTTCIWPFVWFNNLDAPNIERGKERAATIISALNAYQEGTGGFPPELTLLMPVYIRKVPRASWRQEYCYDLLTDNTYTLAFVPRGEAIGDGWVVYWSKYDSWDTTDSDFVAPRDFFDYREIME